jgi:peroxiredoxin
MQCLGHAAQLGRMKDELDRRDTTVLIIGGGSAVFANMAARFLDSPWPLLLDAGRAVGRAYGFGRALGVIQQSGTVLVDRDGIVRNVVSGLNPYRALDRAALLEALDAPAPA